MDADLSKYFDTIPHAEPMQSVARRIVDAKALRSGQEPGGVAERRRSKSGTARGNGA